MPSQPGTCPRKLQGGRQGIRPANLSKTVRQLRRRDRLGFHALRPGDGALPQVCTYPEKQGYTPLFQDRRSLYWQARLAHRQHPDINGAKPLRDPGQQYFSA